MTITIQEDTIQQLRESEKVISSLSLKECTKQHKNPKGTKQAQYGARLRFSNRATTMIIMISHLFS